jgi:arsenical pump membrane protein
MTLAYGSILENTSNINLIYATIIGSNIGAILTPVGALAGIMWMRLLKINNVNYSFIQFTKWSNKKSSD